MCCLLWERSAAAWATDRTHDKQTHEWRPFRRRKRRGGAELHAPPVPKIKQGKLLSTPRWQWHLAPEKNNFFHALTDWRTTYTKVFIFVFHVRRRRTATLGKSNNIHHTHTLCVPLHTHLLPHAGRTGQKEKRDHLYFFLDEIKIDIL